MSCGVSTPGAVYVTSGFEDRIYVLDAGTGAVRDTVPVDPRPGEIDEPHGVATHPASGYWYATVSHGEPTLWKFDRDSDRLVGRVTLPQPGAARIEVSPDGSRGVVPDYFRAAEGRPTRITLLSLDRLEIEATATPCEAPHHGAFSPDGSSVAIACAASDELVIVDGETLDERVRTTLGSPGSRPMNVAWSPDGEGVFVTLMGESRVVRVDAADGRESLTAETGKAPAQIALAPGGRVLAVANRRDRSVSLLDPGNLAELVRAPIPGEHPHGVAFDDAGEVLFVTYEGTVDSPGGVVALDGEGRILWHTELGNFTLGVAFAPASNP